MANKSTNKDKAKLVTKKSSSRTVGCRLQTVLKEQMTTEPVMRSAMTLNLIRCCREVETAGNRLEVFLIKKRNERGG